MNRDNVRVSRRARNHDPENEAAKWNVTAINLIIHTCTRSGPNVLSGKRGFGAKDKTKLSKMNLYRIHFNSILKKKQNKTQSDFIVDTAAAAS